MRYTALETIDRMRLIIADPFAEFKDLDKRQKRVALLAANGKSISEIGEALGIPRNTAGSIIKAVTKKTGLFKVALRDHVLNQIERALDDCCVPETENDKEK